MVLCKNCDKETKNSKFCSRSCSASYNNRVNKRITRTNLCVDCDSLAKDYRSLRCEKHTAEYNASIDAKYKLSTIGEYRNMPSVKDKHPSWVNSHIRLFARSWNKDMTSKCCEMCGYDKHVELAHIVPVASFDDNSTLWEVNNPSNIIALCRNCHWEFDNLDSENFKDIINTKKLDLQNQLSKYQ